MKLGISSYSFTWAVGVPGHLPPNPLTGTDLLNLAKNLGISLVQIADNMPLHEMTEEQLGHLVHQARELNLELEIGAKNLTSPNLERYIQIAGMFHSKILRFVIDAPGYRPTTEGVIAVVADAEPKLRERNIILAIENHDRMFADEFVQIVEKINSPYVGICLDCANSLGVGEGFHEVVQKLAPYTVNFHLKEISINRKYHMMGFDIEGKPFGEGKLPLKWMLEQLPPKCLTAILEQWTPPEPDISLTLEKELDWAKRSIAYLSKYFEK
ncbi:MAG: TIM barrel protein [Prolixibacteraceae bacterium]